MCGLTWTPVPLEGPLPAASPTARLDSRGRCSWGSPRPAPRTGVGVSPEAGKQTPPQLPRILPQLQTQASASCTVTCLGCHSPSGTEETPPGQAAL